MKKKSVPVNFSKMKQLTAPKERFKCSIRVNQKGDVYISKTILDYFIQENNSLYVDFRYTDDYRFLALKIGDNNQFKLPRAGKFKHKELKNEIQDMGFRMPAVYICEKYDEEKMWVGTLQEVTAAPLI